MKGKYFFKDENGNSVEIQEFDYEYVRNSLLKVFDKKVTKKYIFNVIVNRYYDADGYPVFDARPLDLNKIYYDSTRLRVIEMMLDDIYFGNISIQELEVPPLQKEYMEDCNEFSEGRSKPVKVPVSTDIPTPLVHTRVEINENDPRIVEVVSIESNVTIEPLKVLDWIDNFEVCSQEMTASTQKLAEEQIQLVQLLQSNSDYIHNVFSNLTSVLESLFPLKSSLVQRWLGTKKRIEVKQDSLSNILSTLRNAVEVDPNRFSGISVVFKNIQRIIQEIKDEVEQGVIGCKYVIQTSEDSYDFELYQERLMKIRASTEISEMSLVTINKKFLSDLNKLKEVQEVVVPLLIIKLQNQTTNVVDDETIKLINNLAYSRNGNSPKL